ncbi:FAD-dependent monooxygenase [Bradyrhizobium jicamae]|uniref:FAD-dependent monooxygenase n=1 Tax=Bradyrhizobium jicamae TaxID=280332 RepID=UPI001BA8E89A|nr:FAD-dependent monooxygenase [Bradyrhizobium jicamae]MBR0754413.1 FAD-dependent monooxygenase [Bradyrhizobium jicamae]
MYTPNTTPHKSSYFDYEIYPFVRPSEMDNPGAQESHPIAIVGAGPIGLIFAIQLAAFGIKSIVVDAKAQVSGGSRAAALTRRSMEIVEQAGVAREFLRDAILWNKGRSYYRGRIVHELEIPVVSDDKFSPLTNIPQCFMEKILVERALAVGVDLRFQTKLVELEFDDPGGVNLLLDTPAGEYALKADWLVACDGARSAVRKLQNLRFEGNSFEDRFIIGDIRIELDAPPGRRCYFDTPWLPGRTVIMHMLHPNIWRLDYQVPNDVSDDEALDPKRFRAQMQAHLDYIGIAQPWEVEWVTLYKPNALTLSKYNHGRVIYAGDAAHLLPVFGVRGMNTGVQDAINLAWKLAFVIRGQAAPKIVDTYTSERLADAQQICQEASRSTRMVAPPTRGFKLMQHAILSLSLDHEFARGLLHWRTSRPIDYADSVLSIIDETDCEFNAGPSSGAPALNARTNPSTPETPFLFDSLSSAFNVVLFGSDETLWSNARQDVFELKASGLPIRLLAVIDSDSEAPTGADAVIHDVEGNVARRWGASQSALYLLRPDQHVASRWTANSKRRVKDVIRTILSVGDLADVQATAANASCLQ